MESLVCDGLHYTCPVPKYKANLTLCDKERSVCINGFCQGSLCLRYGLEGCMCDAAADKCKVCCQYGGKCTSSFNIPMVSFFFLEQLFLKTNYVSCIVYYLLPSPKINVCPEDRNFFCSPFVLLPPLCNFTMTIQLLYLAN